MDISIIIEKHVTLALPSSIKPRAHLPNFADAYSGLRSRRSACTQRRGGVRAMLGVPGGLAPLGDGRAWGAMAGGAGVSCVGPS